MSLDVYIKYKQLKKRTIKKGLDGVACGSTIAVYPEDRVVEETKWHANITHNMNEMAMHVPTHYTIDGEVYDSDLYMILWRPEEIGIGNICNNTDVVAQGILHGMTYMMEHRKELLQYNPDNGWGSYDAFLPWLMDYWKACVENPGCEIQTWR